LLSRAAAAQSRRSWSSRDYKSSTTQAVSTSRKAHPAHMLMSSVRVAQSTRCVEPGEAAVASTAIDLLGMISDTP
jgi:hypothetical protein